ncbi:glycosyltransferase family 32 protein [Rhizobium puerariae]|uniref:Glycosyltransferase family 32 protein n=1 Tax=Rhizobium puerariae TaxID=1585791 RepID=A0ABV6AFA2_9HYPH
MKTSERYKNVLRAAENLIGNKRFDEARAILEPMMDEAAAIGAVLGSRTSLGLPRRLQSTLLKLAKSEADLIRKIAYQYHLVPPPGTIARHVAFNADERRRMAAAMTAPVPRVIHQIWIGTKPAPVTIEAWKAHADAHGYRHRLWQEDDLRAAGVYENAVFNAMLDAGDYPGAVDVARYLILGQAGGIYLDCDWFPARRDASFHDVLPLTGLGAFAENIPRNTGAGTTLLANSFIAAPPAHPIFAKMVGAMPDIHAELPGAPAWWTTGPLLFTVAARATAINLAPADFVAASAPATAAPDNLKHLASKAESTASGLLIAWKPW